MTDKTQVKMIQLDDGTTAFGSDGDIHTEVRPVDDGVAIVTGLEGDFHDYAKVTIHDDVFDEVLEAMLRARRHRRTADDATNT